MKKELSVIIFILFLINPFVQGQDTIIVTGRYLIGSTVLEGSNNNMESAFVYGLLLEKVKKDTCIDLMSETPGTTKVNEIENIGDSLLAIHFQAFENCSLEFLGEIKVTNENTLNITYYNYGGFASCMCLFKLHYIIKLEKEEREKINKIKYVMINNMEYTKIKINIKSD